MNILISSLGVNAEIVEEALGLFNYSVNDFYSGLASFDVVQKMRDSLGIENGHCIDEVWLLATDRPKTTTSGGKILPSVKEDLESLCEKKDLYGANFRMFILGGISDINDDKDAREFHDMALRVVSAAQSQKEGGKLYVSLACGRKTMSADLQDAVYCFGCDGLLHILGNAKNEATPVFLGAVSPNETLKSNQEPIGEGDILDLRDENCRFLNEVAFQKSKAQHFYTTYYLNQEDKNNFHILYTLPPSKIDALKTEKLGVDPEKREEELNYLRRLPKTELHCHLGGTLSPKEMIEVAKCYKDLIAKESQENQQYATWLEALPEFAKSIRRKPESWKDWYKKLANEFGVHKSLIVAPFLMCFEDVSEKLEKLIFGDYTDERIFQQIGLDAYEKLGDLQGSALLCNENAIRKTVQILIANCKKENIRYVEVRCSPMNYAYGILTPQKVFRAIMEELDKEKDSVKASVIIIASRHNDKEMIEESIRLVKSMQNNSMFAKYFRGFDLAGSEHRHEAKDFRDIFLDIMKDCYNITIHAGETESSDSIWQAVYHLNAERIGHGLTLINSNDLCNKFLERGIGIEMCPSSNYQISGFKDNYCPEQTYSLADYPLKEYLNKELKVSVNTDDPGISRTNITNEYLKAARMTEGGLSKWDVLQLICNGFRTAFFPYEQKKQLIVGAETELAKLIKEDLL